MTHLGIAACRLLLVGSQSQQAAGECWRDLQGLSMNRCASWSFLPFPEALMSQDLKSQLEPMQQEYQRRLGFNSFCLRLTEWCNVKV